MKNLITVLVTIYLTITGIIGAIILFGKNVCDWVKDLDLELPDEWKKFTEDKETMTELRKEGIKIILKAAFCWPYYVTISINGIVKYWKEFKQNEDIKKGVKDACQEIIMNAYKKTKNEEKQEETED